MVVAISDKISYLAGFFDGQGFINYNFNKDAKGRTKFYVVFYQSGHGKEVRKIAEIIEKLGIKVGVYKLKRSKGKLKEYQICITNRRDSEKFLKMILPYLVLKKNYVEEALREFNAYKMSVKRKPV